MSDEKRHRFVAALLIAATAYATIWIGDEFLGHARRLFGYLLNPASKTISSDEDLNSYLAKFGADPDLVMHLVHDSGLSLSPSTRRATIQRLGTLSLRDQLDFAEGAKLPDAVNEYLLDRLTLLGRELNEAQRGVWAALIRDIQGSLGRRAVSDYIEARRQAQNFLETQKLPEEILKAQRILSTFEIAPNPSDLTFFVGVKPDPSAFQSLILSAPSQSQASAPEQEFRLRSTAGDMDLGEARAKLSRVFCDLQFLRPWLPEHLLDDGVQLPSDLIARHFGAKGALRIVPAIMVVFVGLDVDFELKPEGATARFQDAVETGRCCELTSDSVSIRLASTSVRKIGELHYRGRTEPDDPRLVALISRRRAPR